MQPGRALASMQADWHARSIFIAYPSCPTGGSAAPARSTASCSDNLTFSPSSCSNLTPSGCRRNDADNGVPRRHSSRFSVLRQLEYTARRSTHPGSLYQGVWWSKSNEHTETAPGLRPRHTAAQETRVPCLYSNHVRGLYPYRNHTASSRDASARTRPCVRRRGRLHTSRSLRGVRMTSSITHWTRERVVRIDPLWECHWRHSMCDARHQLLC